MNRKMISVILLQVFLLTQGALAIEHRQLKAPELSLAHIGEEVTCYRPMRRGAPNLSIVIDGEKIIANNSGHGGAGWTLGPGSSTYVVDRLLSQYNNQYDKSLALTTPIAVIGAGALGLYSALELYQRGFRDITIISAEFDHLTSHNAGGLLAPVSMDNNAEMQNILTKIGLDAYEFYRKIAEGRHDFIDKRAARIVPTYFRNREMSGLEPYVGKVMQAAKDVVLDFGTGTTQTMVAYDDGIFMDTDLLIHELRNFLKHKVQFEQRKINAYSEVKQDIIISCVGLGARELNNDKTMVPVQGHLLMLKDQNPKDLEYMILVYGDEYVNHNGFKVKESFYFFPKSRPGNINNIGVLGGTFIEGADTDTPHPEAFSAILVRAKAFYGLK